MSYLQLYCTPDSARHLDMTFPLAERITQIHQAVKHRGHKGLYRKTRATAGMIRNLIGIQGRDYFEFTTEGVLPPDVFHQLEWHCFMKVFTAVENDMRFKRSNEYSMYAQLHVVDKSHRQEELVKDYERYRLMLIQQWTRGFCLEEKALMDKATEIVDVYMKREIDLIYRTVEKQSVRERVQEVRHAGTLQHKLFPNVVCYFVLGPTASLSSPLSSLFLPSLTFFSFFFPVFLSSQSNPPTKAGSCSQKMSCTGPKIAYWTNYTSTTPLH